MTQKTEMEKLGDELADNFGELMQDQGVFNLRSKI